MTHSNDRLYIRLYIYDICLTSFILKFPKQKVKSKVCMSRNKSADPDTFVIDLCQNSSVKRYITKNKSCEKMKDVRDIRTFTSQSTTRSGIPNVTLGSSPGEL